MAFMGSPDFSAELLEFIYLKSKNPQSVYQVNSVWSQPSRPVGRGLKPTLSPVERFARDYGLNCYTPEFLSEEDLALLNQNKIDFVLIVAYGQLLPDYVFNHPEWGCFNLHFSLLPQYRGASPLQSAILSGDREGGISFQTVRKKIDTGSIVLQESFSIIDLTFNEYLRKSLEVAKSNFDRFMQSVQEEKKKRFCFLEQDDSQASYCSKIRKEDGLIQKNDSLEKVYLKYLAFSDWPGLYFILKESKYQVTHLTKTSVTFFDHQCPSDSTFVLRTLKMNKKNRLFLVQQNTALEIHSLKKQGKQAVSASDFLNGCRFKFPLSLF